MVIISSHENFRTCLKLYRINLHRTDRHFITELIDILSSVEIFRSC